MRSLAIRYSYEIFESCVSTLRDVFRPPTAYNIFVVWLFKTPFAVIVLLLLPIITFTFAFFATLVDLSERTSSSFSSDALHVPTFYVPKHRYPKWYHLLLLLSLGVVFGGIHCSGWNFSFPTYAEQQVWRFASLAVTVIPIVTVPFALIIDQISGFLFPSDQPIVLTLMFGALAYVSARLVLLGLALALLRHLPPTTFIAINWTKFYPHFL